LPRTSIYLADGIAEAIITESRRSVRTSKPQNQQLAGRYDHLLRDKYYHHLEIVDANREAKSHCDRSIELAPHFVSAYA
jgi:hypothetical protein